MASLEDTLFEETFPPFDDQPRHPLRPTTGIAEAETVPAAQEYLPDAYTGLIGGNFYDGGEPHPDKPEDDKPRDAELADDKPDDDKPDDDKPDDEKPDDKKPDDKKPSDESDGDESDDDWGSWRAGDAKHEKDIASEQRTKNEQRIKNEQRHQNEQRIKNEQGEEQHSESGECERSDDDAEWQVRSRWAGGKDEGGIKAWRSTWWHSGDDDDDENYSWSWSSSWVCQSTSWQASTREWEYPAADWTKTHTTWEPEANEWDSTARQWGGASWQCAKWQGDDSASWSSTKWAVAATSATESVDDMGSDTDEVQKMLADVTQRFEEKKDIATTESDLCGMDKQISEAWRAKDFRLDSSVGSKFRRDMAGCADYHNATTRQQKQVFKQKWINAQYNKVRQRHNSRAGGGGGRNEPGWQSRHIGGPGIGKSCPLDLPPPHTCTMPPDTKTRWCSGANTCRRWRTRTSSAAPTSLWRSSSSARAGDTRRPPSQRRGPTRCGAWRRVGASCGATT